MSLKRVAILGGGNMGEAIAKGIRDSRGILPVPPGQIVIAEPDQSKQLRLTAGGHCVAVSTAREAMMKLAPDGLVVIAVKPQIFPSVAAEIRGMVGARLAISIMAGKTAAGIHRDLGSQCRIVRAMPNLPLVNGDGMTAVCAGLGATPDDLSLARGLFESMGDCIDLDESLMDAFTGLAGSGPAYVAYLAEAMIAGAVATGFDKDLAWRIVRQTIWGSARMLSDMSGEPAELRARVTSKGGTTAAAIQTLDEAGVFQVVSKAIVAARDRGRELSA
jgi:pyrroline-5-carboxylate reductase